MTLEFVETSKFRERIMAAEAVDPAEAALQAIGATNAPHDVESMTVPAMSMSSILCRFWIAYAIDAPAASSSMIPRLQTSGAMRARSSQMKIWHALRAKRFLSANEMLLIQPYESLPVW